MIYWTGIGRYYYTNYTYYIMMKLTCKDLNPNSTCHYEAHGETAKEVAENMMAHATAEHAADLEKMGMSDEEMMQLLESKAHE